MSENASIVDNIFEKDQENSSTSKGDSEVDHEANTSVPSIIETNSRIDLTSRSNESEISLLPTVLMDDSNISVQTSASMENAVQLTESIIKTNKSVEPTTSKNEANISIQTTSLKADISVQSTPPMCEEGITVQPTTLLSEAGISVQPFTSMDEADTPVQPNTMLNEGDITAQPTYPNNVVELTARINEVKISVQSTAPMVVANIPGQSIAAMHDADIFVEPIHETNNTAQPNEADASVQPTEQINEADPLSTEEYQEAFRLFQWVEIKLDLLKIVQGNDEDADNNAQNELRDISLNEKSTLLERMLEEISQQMTSTNIAEKDDCFSKAVTSMLNMLQEITLDVLDSFKVSKSARPIIKGITILIKRLIANIGSEVTLHDVQTFIDGQHVMELFTDFEIVRELRYRKMGVVKSNMELGIRRAQYLKRKSKCYRSKVESIGLECARTVDVPSANQQLKALTKESEVALLKYAKCVGSVLTKAKVFMTLKTDNEEELSYFLTGEIHDMYTDLI